MLVRAISRVAIGLVGSVCIVCVYASTYSGRDTSLAPDPNDRLFKGNRDGNQGMSVTGDWAHAAEVYPSRMTWPGHNSDITIGEKPDVHLPGDSLTHLFTGKGSYSSLALMRQDNTVNERLSDEAKGARITLIGLGGVVYLLWLIATEVARKKHKRD